jgi:DNA (cytosine-5)-methyltransferase 1
MAGGKAVAVDLFGGPGGWDYALKLLGIDVLGIEWDDAACATREAAGLRTLQADVSMLDPFDFAPVRLCIASPPCPSFSSAGKGLGIEDLPLVYEAASAIDAGEPIPELDWKDERSALVVEPLRWALALEPDYLAWEQVPPVLPFWEFCAGVLRERGYSVWTGILSAEQFGVAQTRKRAILMADRRSKVEPPAPTHAKYVKPKKERAEQGLFDAPREVDRIVRPEDRHLLPWVSMAEALGWAEGPEPSPAPTVSGGGTGSGGGVEVFAGAHARRRVLRANAQSNAAVRSADEPAPTITGGHDTGGHDTGDRVWVMAKTEDRPERKAQGAGNSPRPVTDPAATVGSRADLSKWIYDRPAPTIVTTRRSKGWGWNPRQNGGTVRDASEPAPTVLGEGLAKGVPVWDDEPDSRPKAGENAVRVSLEEAAILQSFPPDYPFQGTKSKRFLQVGNAVPVALALVILGELLGVDWPPIHADYLATYAQRPKEQAA